MVLVTNRLVLLVFTCFTLVSAMGMIGRYRLPQNKTGDWSKKFPSPPTGFSFRCGMNTTKTTPTATKTTPTPTTESTTFTPKPTIENRFIPPYTVDTPLDPLDVGGDDMEFADVRKPKDPRKAIDPDA